MFQKQGLLVPLNEDQTRDKKLTRSHSNIYQISYPYTHKASVVESITVTSDYDIVFYNENRMEATK